MRELGTEGGRKPTAKKRPRKRLREGEDWGPIVVELGRGKVSSQIRKGSKKKKDKRRAALLRVRKEGVGRFEVNRQRMSIGTHREAGTGSSFG